MGPFQALITKKIEDLWRPPKDWMATCFLIRHPKGDLLWDTGLDDHYAVLKNGQNFFMGLTSHKVKTPLLIQLKKLGVTPKDIKFVGVSHLHEDHTGNLRSFPHSKILIQEEEKKAAFSFFPSFYFFKFNHYKMLEKNMIPLKGNHDVFGDGKVIILKMPGHTPGHQVLFVKLKNHRPFILAGDLYHTEYNKKYGVIPLMVTYHKETLKKSLKKIEDISKKENAKIWIQHEPLHYKKALKAPLFYD
jgi:glyoxylase-like metal-dependent hydrolase (beta-lactamase superfamily II)